MARTNPTAVDSNPISGIRGAGRQYDSITLTNDPTTTAELNKIGFAFGSIVNESGGALTIAYYGCHAPGGTALIAIDQDAVAASQVVADDRIADIHTACAGVPYLIPVLSSGSAVVSFHFER